MTILLLSRRLRPTPCTVEIEHSASSLHAHVELAGEVVLRPGDRVRVHGPPIRVGFGERLVLRRMATVEHAGWLERVWTRLTAPLGFSELYEVSFTPGRLP